MRFPSIRLSIRLVCAIVSTNLAAFTLPVVIAAEPTANGFLEFVHAQRSALRAGDKPPGNLDEWRARKSVIRRDLERAWGGFPAEKCPLEPKILGTLDRDGYRVEKLIFQTRPGIWMTANAYVPDGPGKRAAVLAVHGHWRGAKQDPVVQARCIGLAKLGFFVLCVDAFGAGERGIGKALGEYHGEMTGATLLPTGLTLSGIQVYENMRAVDYLQSRPEVDPDRIGITGASGGGNQSMYAGAYDERLKAVVPVCSVGTYDAYLGAACCVCELVPGALRITEEGGVLGLTAPRALMLVSATRDAFQFSVPEAKKSLAFARPIFSLFGDANHLKHAIFESGHDYSKSMREAMYGWMTLHLKGQGDGAPISEPEIKTENPETLRCYPGTTRPDDWVTLPRFAASEGRKLVAARPVPDDADAWRASLPARRSALVEKVLGGFPDVAAPAKGLMLFSGDLVVRFQPEPGIQLAVGLDPVKTPMTTPLAIVIDLEGAAKTESAPIAEQVKREGWRFLTLELRATGSFAQPGDKIGNAPDHNTAEWAMWIGRPLLGQWAFDLRRLLDALDEAHLLPKEVVLIGQGPAGLVALTAAATDPRITKVAAVGSLASYVSDEPYVGQRLGVMAPGILREVGDVAHIAALIAPRRVVIAGGVSGGGKAMPENVLAKAYQPATHVWKLLNASAELSITPSTDAAEVIKRLR